MGLHFVACAPKAYWPDPALVEKCKEFARVSGGSITLSEDTDAVAGADVVYTDVWVSMGEPVEVWEERINALSPYQVNAELMAKAKGTAVFMHCLPAYHDHKTAVGKEMGEKFGRDAMEVTDEVFTGRSPSCSRSRKPDAHHQSRDGGYAGLSEVTASLSAQYAQARSFPNDRAFCFCLPFWSAGGSTAKGPGRAGKFPILRKRCNYS